MCSDLASKRKLFFLGLVTKKKNKITFDCLHPVTGEVKWTAVQRTIQL